MLRMANMTMSNKRHKGHPPPPLTINQLLLLYRQCVSLIDSMVFLESLVVKVLVGGAAIITSLRYGTGLYAWRETEKLERPAYEVIQKLSNGVELRLYEPYLIAETTVEGVGFREPTSSGFRACAGYIFGKNIPKSKASSWFGLGLGGSSDEQEGEKKAMTAPIRISSETPKPTGEKMAMTTPVRVQGAAGAAGAVDDTKKSFWQSRKKKTKVSFVMGKQYSMKTAPTPLNSNVKLRQVPAHTLAVRTFSGPPPKDDRVEKERGTIEKALDEAGLQSKSNTETLVYGYHDPFITPNFLRRNEVAVLMEGSL